MLEVNKVGAPQSDADGTPQELLCWFNEQRNPPLEETGGKD